MNGSVAAEQTPHLSRRDVHSFEIESFNPKLLKEEEREGGFGLVLEERKEGERIENEEGRQLGLDAPYRRRDSVK